MAETEKEGRIELIPIEQLKPLPMHFTVIGREEEDMKIKGANSIDPILVRKMTSKEIEEAEEKYPLANAKLSAETQNGNLPSFFIWFENAREPKVWAFNAFSKRRAGAYNPHD
jgi:hypothetical protein